MYEMMIVSKRSLIIVDHPGQGARLFIRQHIASRPASLSGRDVVVRIRRPRRTGNDLKAMFLAFRSLRA
jgi:hypothetical protein